MPVPRSGAFAAGGQTGGQPEPGGVLSDVMAEAVAEHPAGAAEVEPAQEPAARPRRTGKAGGKRAAPPPAMPGRLADAAAMVPLQVKVPRGDHWALKVNTTLRASNMTRVVTALLSVYNNDPELGEALIEAAERQQQSLGELLHDTLVDAAASL